MRNRDLGLDIRADCAARQRTDRFEQPYDLFVLALIFNLPERCRDQIEQIQFRPVQFRIGRLFSCAVSSQQLLPKSDEWGNCPLRIESAESANRIHFHLFIAVAKQCYQRLDSIVILRSAKSASCSGPHKRVLIFERYNSGCNNLFSSLAPFCRENAREAVGCNKAHLRIWRSELSRDRLDSDCRMNAHEGSKRSEERRVG